LAQGVMPRGTTVFPCFYCWLPKIWHGLPVPFGITVPRLLDRDLFKALFSFVWG